MISNLGDLPILSAYLKRVGAKPLNFRRASVTIMEGKYPRAIGRIRMHDDGSMTIEGPIEQPGKEEAEAIAVEYREAEKPESTTLTAIGDLPDGVKADNKTGFVCRDAKGQVVMIHQRVEKEDGTKSYVPWSYWTDGEWRPMEPEGSLPFWGLENAKEASTTLYIHEGAKAAAFLVRLITGLEKPKGFPWLEEMRYGCHIGWIGGVHAVHRSNWEALARMGWKRVVIIADNDPMGKRVVPKISEHFRCPCFTITWDDEFPDGFDLADKFPAQFYSEDGLYTGPSLQNMLQPATWATDEVEIDQGNGRTKIVHVIRQCFAEQWAWIADQDIIVNLELTRYRQATARFNAMIRPFSHVKNTADLLQKQFSGTVTRITYDPSTEARVIKEASGLLAVNLYEPSPIRPVAGSIQPWLEFMEYLIPDAQDRNQVNRWLATLVARPGTRMLYGLLMMSECQGIGKTTLARIAANLVGLENSSFPGEAMITGSEFNGWIANKRLISVGEIYQGHSWKAYNKLKAYVTDDTIEVNIKHQATYNQPNWAHFILSSNSPAALRLEASDRRWFVPGIAEQPWSTERFMDFHTWLMRGGLSHIAHWCHSFDQINEGGGQYVSGGEIAPMSARKLRLIDESRSEAEQQLIALAEQLQTLAEPLAVPLGWLKEWVSESSKNQVYETPQDMARIMRQAGLFITRERIKLQGTRQFLVVNQEALLEWPAARLRQAARRPSEILTDEF